MSVLQRDVVCCNGLQYVAVCCSVMQLLKTRVQLGKEWRVADLCVCVAVCCSVLQCVAVQCTVLQWIAV